MSNTHYVLINDDNEVVAVIKKQNFKGRLVTAIEDETEQDVLGLQLDQIEYNSYMIKARISGGQTYTATLRQTWEY
jgi:hypothetical protein